MSRNIFDVFEQMDRDMKKNSDTAANSKMVTVKNQQGTLVFKNTNEETSAKKVPCFQDKKDNK